MSWGMSMIAIVLSWAMAFPKSFGKHLAEIKLAYDAAIRAAQPPESPPHG